MIINVCQHDWANYSFDNEMALRSVGVDCLSVKEHTHKFGYNNQSLVMSTNDILKLVKQADIVQVFHSDKKMLNLCKIAGTKRIIVHHTGTDYRKGSIELNKLFNPVVERSVIALGEFDKLGAKNAYYMLGGVNVLQSKKEAAMPLRIAHYPSNEKIKGSEIINKVVRSIYKKRTDFNYSYSSKKVSYKEQIERMSECDIYIELFAPFQDGYEYGSFGITALEAAAMGKIVITCHGTKDVYKKYYGIDTPMITACSELELKEKINEVLNMDISEIKKLQNKINLWVNNYHSHKAVGERLKKLYEL